MRQISTTFLKAAVIVIGIPVLAACIFLVPEIANYTAELFPNISFLKYLVLIYLYVAVLPFYFALYQAWLLLSYIDHSKAFSELSVKALKTIKYCAIAISLLCALAMPIFYFIAESEDAPGIIVIGLFIVFASIVIAFFAAVLQKLLHEAIDIKSENDLTV